MIEFSNKNWLDQDLGKFAKKEKSEKGATSNVLCVEKLFSHVYTRIQCIPPNCYDLKNLRVSFLVFFFS